MEIVAGLAGLLIGAATAWVLTRCRAAAEASRLQARHAARIGYWQDEAERAKASAARAEERSAAWSAGYQQGREDVLALTRAISQTNVSDGLTSGLSRS
jgi:uncharacterized protein YfaQ (DUF2300 family)